MQMVRSPHGLSHVSLDETPDQAIVTVVRGSNTIMIEPLEMGFFTPAKLHLRPHEKYAQYVSSSRLRYDAVCLNRLSVATYYQSFATPSPAASDPRHPPD